MFDVNKVMEIETNGSVDVDMMYDYNYSSNCCAHLKKTVDGKISVMTDYNECVATVDTSDEARDILYELQDGVYDKHSRWWVLNHPEDGNANEV